jgi:hypothetical protein
MEYPGVAGINRRLANSFELNLRRDFSCQNDYAISCLNLVSSVMHIASEDGMSVKESFHPSKSILLTIRAAEDIAIAISTPDTESTPYGVMFDNKGF